MARTTAPVLALTALLAVTLGCSTFAQPTPTPTETATPTPSATPTPLPPPTRTPTPASATSSRPLSDGSTEFTDHELGYRLVLPPEWIVLDPSAEDMEAMISAGAGLNPDLAPLVEAFASTAAEGTRFIGLHLNAQALEVGYVPNITMINLGDLGLTLPLVLEATAQSLETMMPGSQMLSYAMIDNLNGSPAGRIEMRMPVTTVHGTQISARASSILIQASGQMLELILSCEESFHSQYAPAFEEVIRSLTVLAP